MGAICCLEKAGLPLHQGLSQNDGRRGQTFFEVLKKEEVGQVKIVEVQEGSFYRQKFKCALNVLRTSIKFSTRWDFKDRRGELRNRRGQLKNQKGASFLKSWACSETTANLLFQIFPHLSHATFAVDGISEIEEASSEIGEASAFPDLSASVTCRVSFAEITGSLLKRQFHISERHLLFQTCQHLSHAEYALRKSRAVCRSADSRYRRGNYFSRHVSICHMQSQLYINYGQFVEVPIPDIGKASAFPNVSAPVTCRLSLTKIMGNLSKISCEVEST
ncbi:hypothetical protein FF2_003153 [Malus domestica]